MSYRPDAERGGFTRVFFIDGGSCFIRRNEYDQLCEAFQAGKPFYEATDLYGCSEVIRLAMVCKVAEVTPEAIAVWDAEKDELRAYEKAHGED